MAFPIVILIIVGVPVMAGWFLLGFRLGGSHWQNRLLETQIESAKARRQLHDLTRNAFVAMAEYAERRAQPSARGKS